MAASLSAAQRQMLRDRILADQESTVARVAALSRDFDEIVASAQLANTDDEHDPEGSTIAYERQKAAALLQSARSNAVDLDRALVALDDLTYGRCRRCGRPIAFERLMAIPNSSTCISCAS